MKNTIATCVAVIKKLEPPALSEANRLAPLSQTGVCPIHRISQKKENNQRVKTALPPPFAPSCVMVLRGGHAPVAQQLGERGRPGTEKR